MFKRGAISVLTVLMAVSVVQAQPEITGNDLNRALPNLSEPNISSGTYTIELNANLVRIRYRDPNHDHASHHDGLHFAHPLISESVSPDTKLRLNYDFNDLEGNSQTNSIQLGAEYAIHRSFSIELGIPYVVLDPAAGSTESRMGNLEVALKFANYAFEESGLLLGYGMEFGLPTGDDRTGIGSDNIIELEPFMNFGLKKGNWEWIGFATFGIPTNQDEGQEFETEFGLNFSSLYHVSPSVQGLLELDGEAVLSGEEAGKASEYFLTPGIKVAPLADKNLKAGTGLRFPISEDAESEVRVLVSVFYHF